MDDSLANQVAQIEGQSWGPEQVGIEVEDILAEHMRRLFVNQTRMSKILCSTGELQEKVIHSIQSLRRKDRKQPHWEGPYQVLLMTAFAVRIAERASWVHITHCKRVRHTDTVKQSQS